MTKTTEWEMRFDCLTYEDKLSSTKTFTMPIQLGEKEEEAIKDFIRKEIESARREVIDELINKIVTFKNHLTEHDSEYHNGYRAALDDVLSTLRKEEV